MVLLPSSWCLCEFVHSTLPGQAWHHHPAPGDLRGGYKCLLDYIFLWFLKCGALYRLFLARLNAGPGFCFPCFPMPLLRRDLVPLTKVLAT